MAATPRKQKSCLQHLDKATGFTSGGRLGGDRLQGHGGDRLQSRDQGEHAAPSPVGPNVPADRASASQPRCHLPAGSSRRRGILHEALGRELLQDRWLSIISTGSRGMEKREVSAMS